MAKMTFTIQDRPFTVNYPDEMEGQLTEIMAAQMGYQAYVPNPDYPANPTTQPAQIENPQDKLTFVVNNVVARLVGEAKMFMVAQQVRTAQATIQEQVNAAVTVSVEEG